MNDGTLFDIYRPDLVRVGRNDIDIGFSKSGDLPIYDRVTRVAMAHVVALEDLPLVPGKGNGQQQGSGK